MNWEGTRNRLIEINSKFEDLPVKWRTGIDLIDANLRNANLNGAILSNANLNGAILYNAGLSYANLSKATLNEADLSYANLSEADLSNAQLRYTDLSKANLNKADLYNTNLSDTDLSYANLSNADLYNTNLNGAILNGVLGIIVMQFDSRGYQLVCWQSESEIMFNAGCRSFTYDEALAHWGSIEYENQTRGQQYVKAVKFLAESATNE